MLTKEHQERYEAFYESTHQNQCLDTKTELLVGLSAAIADERSAHQLSN